jgi:PAS domain S-box-containing protein
MNNQLNQKLSPNQEKGNQQDMSAEVISIDGSNEILKDPHNVLGEASEWYQDLVEKSNLGILIDDIDGNLKYYNKRLYQMFGYSSEEIKSLSIQSLIHPEDLKRVMNFHDQRMKGKKISDRYEFRGICKDNTIIFLEVDTQPIRDNGTIIGSRSYLWDISKRKISEQALAYSEEKFRELFNNANDAIYLWEVNKDNQIIRCIEVNDVACKLTGYSRAELLSFLPAELDTVNCRSKIPGIMKELFAKNHITFETEHRKKNGQEFPVEISSHLFNLQGKVVVMSISRDISDRKNNEKKFQQMLVDLSQSNNDLEQFAYGVSHDLQAPLRTISGFLNILKKRYHDKLDENALDYIQFAVDGAGRMTKMIKDLLEFPRIGTRGKPFMDTDCNTVFDCAIQNLKKTIEDSRASIEKEKLPIVKADESQLIRLFQNLIDNAIKYSNKEKPRVKIKVKKESEFWQFSVSDNGIGIDEKSYERIFHVFHRLYVTNNSNGTGIGLAICKKIVERHGGSMWLKSKINKGSTFYFNLPFHLERKTN